ncbi:MAG: hypothetical protein COA45_01525 [Zetaproteobacteria bacterium]|nr:MAG: hypothetical protein COA45_01525 [Zetaproteobacteria bacterium]
MSKPDSEKNPKHDFMKMISDEAKNSVLNEFSDPVVQQVLETKTNNHNKANKLRQIAYARPQEAQPALSALGELEKELPQCSNIIENFMTDHPEHAGPAFQILADIGTNHAMSALWIYIHTQNEDHPELVAMATKFLPNDTSLRLPPPEA